MGNKDFTRRIGNMDEIVLVQGGIDILRAGGNLYKSSALIGRVKKLLYRNNLEWTDVILSNARDQQNSVHRVQQWLVDGTVDNDAQLADNAVTKPFFDNVEGNVIRGASELQLLVALVASRWTALDVADSLVRGNLRDKPFGNVTADDLIMVTKNHLKINARSGDAATPVDLLIDRVLGATDLINRYPSHGVNYAKGLVEHMLYSKGLLTRDHVNGSLPYNLSTIIDHLEQTRGGRGEIRLEFIQKFKAYLKTFIYDTAKQLIQHVLDDTKGVTGGVTLADLHVAYNAPAPNPARVAIQKSTKEILAKYLFNNSDDVFTDSAVTMGRNNFLKEAGKSLESGTKEVFKNVIKGKFGLEYTTFVSDASKSLWENVFKRWSSLDDDTKKFYTRYVKIHKRETGGLGWKRLDDKDYDKLQRVGPGTYKDYRFNMEKDIEGADKKVTLFEKDIRDLKLNTYGMIYYKDNDNALKRVAGNRAVDFLRKLYHKVYTTVDRNTAIEYEGMNLPGNLTIAKRNRPTKVVETIGLFSKHIGKILRIALFRVKKAEVVIDDVVEPEEKYNEYINIASITPNLWGKDEKGYYKLEKGVKKYTIGKKSTAEEYAKYDRILDLPNRCSTSIWPQKTCGRFIFECLLADDDKALDKCLAVARDTSFEHIAAGEINKVHPMIAKEALSKLGFRVKTNSLGEPESMENVSEWLRRLPRDKVIKIQENNEDLLRYLNLLSAFINANKSVIDPSIKPADIVRITEPLSKSEYGRKLNIPLYRQPPHEKVRQREWDIFVANRKLRVRTLPWFMRKGKLRFPFGHQFTPGAPMFVRGQLGGNPVIAINHFRTLRKTDPCHIIGELVKVQIERLKGRNKTLSKKSLNDIKALTDGFNASYKKLMTYKRYVEVYNEILDHHADYDEKTLSIEKLQNLVDTYKRKQEKLYDYGDAITKMLMMLEDMYSKTVGKKLPTYDTRKIRL